MGQGKGGWNPLVAAAGAPASLCYRLPHMTWQHSRPPTLGPSPDDQRWDAEVAASEQGHFLQSSAWARFRRAQGWVSRRLRLPGRDGAAPLGAQILVRGRRPSRWAYVPRGPVASPDDPRLPDLWSAIRAACADCVFVRVEPQWPDTPVARSALRAAGLLPAPPVQPPSTLLLDLADGAPSLLAAMKPKWRYNIGLAERKGVVVRRGREAADWAAFEALVQGTARRNGFHARPPGYYRAAGEAFGQAAHLLLAEADGQVLAGILVLHWGDTATYLYGGSSDHHRERMPNHLLQWRAIEGACAAGLARYDFWGVPDAVGLAGMAGQPLPTAGDDGDGLWGVWGFKRGFGGRAWRAVGAADLVIAPFRHALALRLQAGSWRGLLRRTP